MAEFMGKDGFIWWQGVVEDRYDPLYLGRCRIRILGWHTEDKTDMPTESLPWAYPIQPITSAAQTGVGISPTGPVVSPLGSAKPSLGGIFESSEGIPPRVPKKTGSCACSPSR